MTQRTPLPLYVPEDHPILQPDISAEAWWRYAEYLPWAATQSPLYDLMLLEAPERWNALERQHAGSSWVSTVFHGYATKDLQYLWMADCVRRLAHHPEMCLDYACYRFDLASLLRWVRDRSLEQDYLAYCEAQNLAPAQVAIHIAYSWTKARSELVWQWRRLVDWLKAWPNDPVPSVSLPTYTIIGIGERR